jgi:hypothetical protein
MSDTVEYIVKLKDEMSGTVNAVKHSTHEMNKEIEHSHSVVHELRNAFFELFALEKTLEFFNGAREALEKYKFASAELDATLESNAENIGFTRKELDALGDAARKNTLFTKTDVTAMEGQLAIFKNVHGYIAQEAIPIILNFAAKTKTTAAEAAKTLGIALNEPAHAARLLRGAIGGVDEAQQKFIDNLIATHQQAKAQQYILDLMSESYKGAAAAAWEAADPLARLGVRFEDTKIKVGTLIEELLEKLEPAMNAVVDATENSVDFIKSYGTEIQTLAGIVGAATTAFIVYTTAQKAAAFWTAVTTTTVKSSGAALVFQTLLTYGLAEAWQMLTLVMMENPFVFITAGIIAVGAVIYECWQHLEGFKKVLWATWEVIKGLGITIWDDMIAPFKALYYSVKGVWAAIHGEFATAKADFAEAGKAMLAPFKDVQDAISNTKKAYGKSYSTVKSAGESGEGKKSKNGLGIVPPTEDLHTGASSVKETKPTIINITMGSLVHSFNIVATNLNDSSAKVREEILKVMISAVSDSQAHAIGNT